MHRNNGLNVKHYALFKNNKSKKCNVPSQVGNSNCPAEMLRHTSSIAKRSLPETVDLEIIFGKRLKAARTNSIFWLDLHVTIFSLRERH